MKRRAFVIGINDGYGKEKLANAAADASLLAGFLPELGFEVTLLASAELTTAGSILDALRTTDGEDDLFIWFSSHGSESNDFYVHATDRPLAHTEILKNIMVDSEHSAVIVYDACRSGYEHTGSIKSSLDCSVENIRVYHSTMSLASDGREHSPFLISFLEAVQKTVDGTSNGIFTKAADIIADLTDGAQKPEWKSTGYRDMTIFKRDYNSILPNPYFSGYLEDESKWYGLIGERLKGAVNLGGLLPEAFEESLKGDVLTDNFIKDSNRLYYHMMTDSGVGRSYVELEKLKECYKGDSRMMSELLLMESYILMIRWAMDNNIEYGKQASDKAKAAIATDRRVVESAMHQYFYLDYCLTRNEGNPFFGNNVLFGKGFGMYGSVPVGGMPNFLFDLPKAVIISSFRLISGKAKRIIEARNHIRDNFKESYNALDPDLKQRIRELQRTYYLTDMLDD